MKPKKCGECNKEFPSLWRAKRKITDGTIIPAICRACALKDATPIGEYKMASNKAVKPLKKSKPIPKLSEKEKKRQQAYSVLKPVYIRTHPHCEVRLPGCSFVAKDIHHLFMGSDRYKYFLDTTTWKAVCRSCHQKIHDELSAEKLIELGLRRKE